MATAVLTRAHPVAGRSPIALWHLLSLDAPCVAAVWTDFLARQFRIDLPLGVPFALGLTAWLLYAADRIRDATCGEIAEERHRFHLLHRKGFMAAGLAVTLVLAVLVAHLPHAVRTGWLMLTVPLCAYLLAVHGFRLRRISKEPLVAILFTTAVLMPLLVSRVVPSRALFLTATAFGSLCWLNCIAIARWEETLVSAGSSSAWLGRRFPLAVALTMSLAAPLLLSKATICVGLAVISAAFALLLLDAMGRSFLRPTRRGLADAALLSPLLVWPLLRLLNAL